MNHSDVAGDTSKADSRGGLKCSRAVCAEDLVGAASRLAERRGVGKVAAAARQLSDIQNVEDLPMSVSLYLSPNTTHQWYATLLAAPGRIAEAKAEMRRALEIDPLSPNFLPDGAPNNGIHPTANQLECHRDLAASAVECAAGDAWH